MVTFVDYSFSPSRITVPSGTRVIFTNTGKQFHNAASSDGGGWDTGLLGTGKSAAVTFNRPGTFSYACLPHAFMIGQIIVTGAAIESAPPTVVERNVTLPANSTANTPANTPTNIPGGAPAGAAAPMPAMPGMPARGDHPE
jgi:hypothetical protein